MQAQDNQNAEGATEPELSKPRLFCSARLILCVTCFIAIFNTAYVRTAISMAFVCMVAPEQELPHANQKQGEFAWSSAMIGYLMSASFYGFIAGPFVSGILCFKFGGKIVMVIGNIATGCTHLLIPEGTRKSAALFFVIRVFTGFFCSFTIPAFYDLMSHWIIPEETQLLVTGALVGIPVANIVNFPISGAVCDWLGWVWLFYSLGLWMILFGAVIWFIIFNYPDHCTYITEKELNFLKVRIVAQGRHKIPWKAIIRSAPIYAYVIMHYSMSYVQLTMVLSLPLFMTEFHNISLETNGLLSATPFLGSFIMRILIGLFYEQLRLKLKVSKNTLRKAFVFIGATLGTTFLLLFTLFSLAHKAWVLGCLVLALCSIEMCVTGGYLLSLLDLCPTYVNIITGIANTIANAAGLINPVVNGLLTPQRKKEEWNNVFYINIAVLLGAATFYLAFGQNSLQPWGLGSSPTGA